MLTVERARELLEYDSNTGVLRWRVTRSGHIKAGEIVGAPRKNDGYIQFQIDGKEYYAHRVAWLIYYGCWPEHQIDHTNRNKSDNRIENLRLATNSQNVAYAPKKKTKSGYRGVTWKKGRDKWCAKIRVQGKMIHIGYFDDPKVAHEAYKAAAIKHFGEFAAF